MKLTRFANTSLGALVVAAIVGVGSASGLDPAAAPQAGPRQAAAAAAPQPAAPAAGAMITREWRVPANLIPRLPAPAASTPPSPSGLADKDSAKQWLIGKGVVFGDQAAAVYIASTSRLIVRNTQAQLDLVDAIVNSKAAPAATAGAVRSGAPASPVAAISALEKKASETVIPKIELREATLTEALQVITTATGIKTLAVPAGADGPKITLSLTSVPASEALLYVAGLTERKVSYEKDVVRLISR